MNDLLVTSGPQLSTFWDNKIIFKLLLTIGQQHHLNIFGPDCTD